MYMSKLINLSNKAYTRLCLLKEKDMSFSDIILKYLKEDKTETKEDLLCWIKQLPKTKDKEDVTKEIDKIVYGV